jgi:hypothetical protein
MQDDCPFSATLSGCLIVLSLYKQVSLLEDVNQVKRLQRAYSYYVLRMMKNEIADCFAEHPETGLYWLEGAYLDKEAVKRYFGGGRSPVMFFLLWLS